VREWIYQSGPSQDSESNRNPSPVCDRDPTPSIPNSRVSPAHREFPSLVTAARAVIPVNVLDDKEMTPLPTDSAPPTEPPVRDAGALAEAPAPPCFRVHLFPLIDTCTTPHRSNIDCVAAFSPCVCVCPFSELLV